MISLKVPVSEIGHMMFYYKLYTIFATIILLIGIVIVYIFIRKLDQKDKKLFELAKKDPLTQIYNRQQFKEDMQILSVSKRDESVVMLIFDIDYFKKINDTYGHLAGDNVLKELTALINKEIRPNDKFYRIGGEEFAILSYGQTLEREKEFAERLLKIVNSSKFSNVEAVSISIGYAQYFQGEDTEHFYERCDNALYAAKDAGRNCAKAAVS